MRESDILTEADMPMILTELFKRVQTDSEFRNLCLQNPKEAVFVISGKMLPDGSKLSFADSETIPVPEENRS